MNRVPWKHQSYADSEVARLIESGCRSMCVTSPTGGGKGTIIQMHLERFVAEGHQCALFTNRKLLTAQLARGLSESGIHLGIRAAEFEAWTDTTAPVQICSTQTEVARVLNGRVRARFRAKSEDEANRSHSLFPATRILIDEGHLNKGDQMSAILNEYREKYDATLISYTATPLGIGHLYDELIVAGNNSELRACGALVPAYCYEPASFDIWKIRRTKTGVYSQQELEDRVKAIWSQHVVGHVYHHWRKLNKDTKPSLGMAPGVKESLGLAVDFWKHGVNAAHISADGIFVDGQHYTTTRQEDRDEIFARSKSGEIPMIWNRYVLREAIDLPWLEFLSLATPIASLTSFLQVVGRVLRASPKTGKVSAILCDHGGAVRMHGSPNLDRDDDWRRYFRSDEEQVTKDRLNKLRDPNNSEPEPITCPNCGMIRKTGKQCPGCKFEHEKSTRKVIQESGQLKAVQGDVFPKRREKVEKDTAKLWSDIYWAFRNSKKPMTFSQARGKFVRDHKYWPPKDLPYMPKNEADWSRRVNAVPFSDLIPKGYSEPQQPKKRDTLFDE